MRKKNSDSWSDLGESDNSNVLFSLEEDSSFFKINIIKKHNLSSNLDENDDSLYSQEDQDDEIFFKYFSIFSNCSMLFILAKILDNKNNGQDNKVYKHRPNLEFYIK